MVHDSKLTRLEIAELKRQPWRNSWQIIRDIEVDPYFYEIHQHGPNICGLFEGGADPISSHNIEWAISKADFIKIARDLGYIDDFSNTHVYDRVARNIYRPDDDDPVMISIDAWFENICDGSNQEIFSKVLRAWFADQKARAIDIVIGMKEGREFVGQFLALRFLQDYFRQIRPDDIL